MDVVVVGSALIDIVVRSIPEFKIFYKNFRKYLSIPYGSKVEIKNFEFHIGGSGHNIAVDLAKFGHEVGFVGKVGNDFFGNQIINNFKKEGVDIRNLKIVKKGFSGFSINFLLGGEKSILVYNGYNLDLNPYDIPKKDIKNSKWFVFTSITSKNSLKFLEEAIKFSRKNGIKILANPSIRMIKLRRKQLLNFIKNSDITVMNEEEIYEFARAKNVFFSMKKVFRIGTKLVVVTLGKNGSIAYDGKKIYRQKGFKVKPIDSTGCGDSFTAAFLHYILKEKTISEALEFATATGALELQRIGATNIPTEKEIIEFISKTNSFKPR